MVWRLAAMVYAVAQGVGALNRVRTDGYRRGYRDGAAMVLAVTSK